MRSDTQWQTPIAYPFAGIAINLPDYYIPLMAVSLALNLLAQIIVLRIYAAKMPKDWLKRLFHDNIGNLYQMEAIVFAITFATNFFFLTRMLPIWTNSDPCFIFHGVVMAVFELQMAAYGYIQMQRFGFHVIPNRYRVYATWFLAVCSIFLAVMAGIWQNGYIDNGMTCHFLHDYRVSMALAAFHLAIDIGILITFRKASKSSVKMGNRNVRVLYIAALCVLILFGVWNLYLSIANLVIGAMPLEVSYNFHFTLILVCMVFPRFVQRFLRAEGGTVSDGQRSTRVRTFLGIRIDKRSTHATKTSFLNQSTLQRTTKGATSRHDLRDGDMVKGSHKHLFVDLPSANPTIQKSSTYQSASLQRSLGGSDRSNSKALLTNKNFADQPILLEEDQEERRIFDSESTELVIERRPESQKSLDKSTHTVQSLKKSTASSD